jgi:hypothetical protein
VAVIRKQILLEANQNKRLKKLRAVTGLSESELIRRAVDAYDPENASALETNAEVRELLETLVEQNAKTAKALERADGEIAATERYLAKLRAARSAKSAPKRRAQRKPKQARG